MVYRSAPVPVDFPVPSDAHGLELPSVLSVAASTRVSEKFNEIFKILTLKISY